MNSEHVNGRRRKNTLYYFVVGLDTAALYSKGSRATGRKYNYAINLNIYVTQSVATVAKVIINLSM